VVCWNIWGKVHANNTTTEIQKQDSIINYNAGEYDRLLQEQIELYKQLRTYEDAQLTAKTTYKRTRSAIIIRDTINRVDVITLVNSCDSVIASDSLVINNLKEQLNIEEEKINNLQEVVVAYEQKENILTEEINNLAADKKKLEKQKKRRNHALVVTSTVAILSTFVLSILL
jgi:DNA repair exonuclease SbcCD ATPase subunit